jgi:hypothetical protein
MPTREQPAACSTQLDPAILRVFTAQELGRAAQDEEDTAWPATDHRQAARGDAGFPAADPVMPFGVVGLVPEKPVDGETSNGLRHGRQEARDIVGGTVTYAQGGDQVRAMMRDYGQFGKTSELLHAAKARHETGWEGQCLGGLDTQAFENPLSDFEACLRNAIRNADILTVGKPHSDRLPDLTAPRRIRKAIGAYALGLIAPLAHCCGELSTVLAEWLLAAQGSWIGFEHDSPHIGACHAQGSPISSKTAPSFPR